MVNTDALFFTLCKEVPHELDGVLSLPKGEFSFAAPVFKSVEKRVDAVFVPLDSGDRPRLHEFYNYAEPLAYVDAVIKACLYAEKHGVMPETSVVFAKRVHVPRDEYGIAVRHGIRTVILEALDERFSNVYVEAVLWAANAPRRRHDERIYRNLRRRRPEDLKFQRIIAYIMREKHAAQTGQEPERGWDLSLSVEEIFMRSEGWLGELLRKVARESLAKAQAENKRLERQLKKAEAKAEAARQKAEAEKIAVARKMLAEGMAPKTVAKIIGLPQAKFMPPKNS